MAHVELSRQMLKLKYPAVKNGRFVHTVKLTSLCTELHAYEHLTTALRTQRLFQLLHHLTHENVWVCIAIIAALNSESLTHTYRKLLLSVTILKAVTKYTLTFLFFPDATAISKQSSNIFLPCSNVSHTLRKRSTTPVKCAT